MGVAKKGLTYLAVLTGLYIVVFRATNAGLLIDKASAGIAGIDAPFLK